MNRFSNSYRGLFVAVLGLTSVEAHAQGSPGPGALVTPGIITIAPGVNLPRADRTADVQVTFRRQVIVDPGPSPISVWGSLTGYHTGTFSGTNTRQVRFDPVRDFLPGEIVQVSYPDSPPTRDIIQPNTLLFPLAYQYFTAPNPTAGPLTAQNTPAATNLTARQVKAADLDGDNDVDLVVLGTTTGGAGQLQVRLNNGSGTFSAGSTLAVAANAVLDVADLSNDGRPDLLLANPSANNVSVYLNSGTGSFAASTNVAVGPGPRMVRAYDLEMDGDQDFVTPNANNTISVRYNDGTGTFSTGSGSSANPSTITGVGAVRTIAFNDLEQNYTHPSAIMGTNTALKVWYTNGAGNLYTFNDIPDRITAGAVNDILLGDFNNDTYVDVLLATTQGLQVGFYPSTPAPMGGPQQFGTLSTLAAGENLASAAIADIDGDGDLDILAPSPTNNVLRQWLNPGTGIFGAPTNLSLGAGGSQPAWVAAADLDGNHTLDAVTANALAVPTTGAAATLLLNGSSTNSSSVSVSSGTRYLGGTYSDVTASGSGVVRLRADLIVNGTLTVQSGATLRTEGYRLRGPGAVVLASGANFLITDAAGVEPGTATGDIRTTGPRSLSASALYRFEGYGAQQTGAGLPNPLDELMVNNPQGVTVSAPLGVRRLVRLTSGNLNATGHLTLLADASGTAMVVNTSGAVTGTATMQRFITGTSAPGVAYRHLSSPTQNSPVSDLTTAGFTPVVNSAFNGAPSPLAVRPYPNVFGYNESLLTTPDFTRGYFSPASAGSILAPGKGYSVAISASAKPDFTGTLTTGTVGSGTLTRGVTPESGWHLLGNPYPSPLDWDVLALPATMSKQVYVFRPTGGTSGTYVARLQNGTTSPDPNGVLTNGLLAPMQGFFVRVLSGSASFNFTNAARPTTYTNAAGYRAAPDTRPQVRLLLTSAADGAQNDGATVTFEAGATAGSDADRDAWKLPSVGDAPTLATRAAGTGEALIIDARPALASADVAVPVSVTVPTAGTWTLSAQVLNLPAGWRARLVDALTGTQQDLTTLPNYPLVLAAGEVSPTRLQLLLTRLSGVTGVSADAVAADLLVYPNPAHGTVRVLASAGAAEVRVLDALGRCVARQAIGVAGAETVLDVAHLRAGVYVVRAGRHTRQLVIE